MKKTVQANPNKPNLVLRREQIRVLTSDELSRAVGGDRPTTNSDACGGTNSGKVQTC